MTVDPLDLELRAIFEERQAHAAPAGLHVRVRSIPASHATRGRGWWRGGPTTDLSGVLRLGVALVIVVGIGGSLLAVLAPGQPESTGVTGAPTSSAPAAETTPSPTRTPPPVKMEPVPSMSIPTPTITPLRRPEPGPLLPGVALVTEEVEPGVLRVEGDGVRTLTREGVRSAYAKVAGPGADAIAAGPDGSVWLLWPDGDFFRLGDEESHSWGAEMRLPFGFPRVRVAPDGSLWSIGAVLGPDGGWMEGDEALYRFADGLWDMRAAHARSFDVDLDGVVWVVQQADDRSSIGRVLPEGVVQDVEFDPGYTIEDMVANPASTDRPSERGAFDAELWVRTADGEFTAVQGGEGAWGWGSPEVPGRTSAFDVGPDGTVWQYLSVDMPALGQAEGQVESVGPSYLARREPHSGWTVYGSESGVPAASPSFLRVGPDGAVWLGQNSSEMGVYDYCDGISRFDGSGWRHYLADRCVTAVEIGADGSVWLLVGDQPASGEITSIGTYVIPAGSSDPS